MARKILIGTVTLDSDTIMNNRQFGYAASFEDIKVEKGSYLITAYEDDLKRYKDELPVLANAYIEYTGTLVAGNVGGKPGDRTLYHQWNRGYTLAEKFLTGHDYQNNQRKSFDLRSEWGLDISEGEWEGKRFFCLNVVLKDPAAVKYICE